MFKKVLISIVAISSILLVGCSDKTKFEFNFDEFNGYFFTENIFSIDDIESNGLSASLLKNDIISTYTQTQSEGYTDSIIIIKKISSQTLDEFVLQNIKKTKINEYTLQNTKNNTIKCNDKKIKIKTIKSYLEGNLNNIFFAQTFFAKSGKMYIISFSSDHEKERDSFASSIQNIKCK